MPAPFRETPLEQILPPDPATPAPINWRGRPGEQTPLWAILGEQPPLSQTDGWHAPMAFPEPAPGAFQPPARAANNLAQPATGGDHGFLGDVASGVASWGRGIGRFGTHVFDTMGATNAQDHAAALRANDILYNTLKQTAAHPRETWQVIQQAAPLARDYVYDHPGEVGGRAGTGMAAYQIGKRLRVGNIGLGGVGLALNVLAAYGDAVHGIRNGASTVDEIVGAALNGGYFNSNGTGISR